MASKFEAFCNNTTDLSAIFAGIDNMDRKVVLPPNWSASGTSNLYYLYGTGSSSGSILFKDGEDLGSEQGSQPSSDDQFRMVEADDRLEYYLASSSASALNGIVFEMGEDADSLKTKVCKEQADRIRSYMNRPILKRSNTTYQGASERNYDWVVIRCNAALAVADLIRSSNPEQAEDIESRILNEAGTGLLDRLKRGEYNLWNETTWPKEKGVITTISQDASSTGYIEDIKLEGRPTTYYDDVRAVISSGGGGTFTVGTANTTVKYDVYIANDDGLKQQKVVDAELINGSYQPLAYCAFLRWSPGIFVAGDEFSILFQSDEVPIGTVKSGQIYR